DALSATQRRALALRGVRRRFHKHVIVLRNRCGCWCCRRPVFALTTHPHIASVRAATLMKHPPPRRGIISPMTKRDAVIDALKFRRPAYVPWEVSLTIDCRGRLADHLGTDDLSEFLDGHFLELGSDIGRFEPVDEDHVRDLYGVLWDRSVDKDIGTPVDWPIKTPADLDGYQWPDATDDSWYEGMPEMLAACPGRFSRFPVGFSLYERAWTMRGMSALLMDMVERPEFVDRLLGAIVEHNLIQIHRALDMGVDCIHFGDDYGMQTGLIMGADLWRRFFKPNLARMFQPVRDAGKCVYLHSCGRVQELFDDLVEIGLNMFNPFQPEVMDVFPLKKEYHGRLAFHGGMGTQKLMSLGTPDDVRDMTQRLIGAGSNGGYVFSPSHAVPPDVPPENIIT
ncbi:hypothetical protein LCGC14_2857660, partial [marine sediment metagenome]